MALSVLVIASVTLTVAAAVQSVGGRTMAGVLAPVFGPGSVVLLSVLAVALCLVTELAFTGAVSRLMAALASDGALPAFLARRNGSGAPSFAATALTAIHLFVLALSLAGVLSVEKMVALANGFFLANAIMALLAGARVLGSRIMRVSAALLAVVLGCVLVMSSWLLLLALAGVTWWVLGRRDESTRGLVVDESRVLDPD